MPENKSYFYGPYSWGLYYNNSSKKEIRLNSLTKEETLSIYLYGNRERPHNPADYIRSLNAKEIIVKIDSKSFINGVGRIVPYVFSQDMEILKFFQGFYDGHIKYLGEKSSTGEISASFYDVVKYNKVVKGNKNELQNVGKYDFQFVEYGGYDRWLDGTFIFNSMGFRLYEGAQFILRLGKNGEVVKRYMKDIKFKIFNDDYDYMTSGSLKSDISKYKHGEYHDPYNIGRKFLIEFEGGFVEASEADGGSLWDEKEFLQLRE